MKFGSVCSGIEAASVALSPLGFEAVWFSEIADFPSKLLKDKYPGIPNLGDMNELPIKIRNGETEAPDLLCGGTPCQAFSLAGWKNGLVDSRGQLTLKFIDIADAIDEVRFSQGKSNSIIFWENVEGVLKDKTNAFGSFIAGLAGFDEPLIPKKKWTNAGMVFGPKRNVAWRVLDAKYFGLPQQRKRLFVISGGVDYHPGNVLFEFINDRKSISSGNTDYQYSFNKKDSNDQLSLFSEDVSNDEVSNELLFFKNGIRFEVFREYTDCLYSAYGTKWNGNAAAYNGSLYIYQNYKLRRFSPLECERLMGFPDNYTLIKGCKDTQRYQAVGNSWAVPVVHWLGERILQYKKLSKEEWYKKIKPDIIKENKYNVYFFENDLVLNNLVTLNISTSPNIVIKSNLKQIVDPSTEQKFYISEAGLKGILRRKNENNIKMNPRLESIMQQI